MIKLSDEMTKAIIEYRGQVRLMKHRIVKIFQDFPGEHEVNSLYEAYRHAVIPGVFVSAINELRAERKIEQSGVTKDGGLVYKLVSSIGG